jgi:hypothetical protein
MTKLRITMKALCKPPFFALLVLMLQGANLQAQEILEFDAVIYTKIFSYEEATAPEYWNNQVIFSYANPDMPVRYVAAVFEHEDYSKKHVFFKKVGDGTQAGSDGEPVFLLLYDPGDQEILRYRLIVDGLWQSDPMAARTERDEFGNNISVYELPQDRPSWSTARSPERMGGSPFITGAIQGTGWLCSVTSTAGTPLCTLWWRTRAIPDFFPSASG